MFVDGKFDSIALESGEGVYYCAVFEVVPGGVVSYLVPLFVFHLEEADCLPGYF